MAGIRVKDGCVTIPTDDGIVEVLGFVKDSGTCLIGVFRSNNTGFATEVDVASLKKAIAILEEGR